MLQCRTAVLLAPMSGVTDAPFRRLVSQLGAGLVVSEMTASDALVEGRRNAVLRAEGQGTGTHVVQLAGCEPHWMAEGARIAEGAGADIIDINMGCPAKHVANRQSGSALMRDLDHALTLIEATVGAVALPVTLKMRLGWDDRSINAPELARRAEAAGVRMITVHGRTRCQFYKGSADWDAVRAVKDARFHSARRQRRHLHLRRRGSGARRVRRRRRHDRPRGAGPALAARPGRALSADRPRAKRRRRSPQQFAMIAGALRGDARPSRPAHRAQARPQASRLGARRGGRQRRRRLRHAQALARHAC